jgi:hypothetical protein
MEAQIEKTYLAVPHKEEKLFFSILHSEELIGTLQSKLIMMV